MVAPPGIVPEPWISKGSDTAGGSMADAEFAQCGQHRSDRAVAHMGVAVEADPAARQSGDRWDEPHHRPGETTIDLRTALAGSWGDQPVFTRGVDSRAEGSECSSHQVGIPRPQRTAYGRWPVSEGGQD